MAHDRYYDDNSDRVSVHWTVDALHAVLSVPEDRAAWHAGNRDYNLSYIGVEICKNNVQIVNDKLELDDATYNNAVILAADILNRHGWGIDKMIQHRNVPGREWKNCPNRDLFDWNQFRRDVEKLLIPKEEPEQPAQSDKPKKLYRVQVGAFAERENAERLAAELRSKGYPTIIKEEEVK